MIELCFMFPNRFADETVQNRRVRTQTVLRDESVLGVQQPVGREGQDQQQSARPHAELRARYDLPGKVVPEAPGTGYGEVGKVSDV